MTLDELQIQIIEVCQQMPQIYSRLEKIEQEIERFGEVEDSHHAVISRILYEVTEIKMMISKSAIRDGHN